MRAPALLAPAALFADELDDADFDDGFGGDHEDADLDDDCGTDEAHDRFCEEQDGVEGDAP